MAKKKISTRRRRPRKRLMTAADLTRLRLASDAQISPDGSEVAFVHRTVGSKNDYVTNIWLVDAAGGSPRQFTNGGKDGAPRWSPDGARLAFISGRQKGRPQIAMIDRAGGEAQVVSRFSEGRIASFKWSPDGRHLAVSFREQDPDWTEAARKQREEAGLSDPPRSVEHWWYRLDGDGYFNAQRFALYLLDTDTGDHRVIYDKDTLGAFSYDFSPDGRELIVGSNRDRRAGLRAWNDDLVRIDVRTGKQRVIPNLPKGPKESVAWSPDGRSIAYAGREGDDSIYSTENLDLWVYDLKTRKAKCVTGRDDYCLMAIALADTSEAVFGPVFMWSRDSRRLFVQIGWHGESHLATVKRGGGRVEMLTSGAKAHNLGNLSADGRRMAMCVGSTTRLEDIHVAEIPSSGKVAVTAVTNLNRELLSELELSKPKSHWIKSEDGTKVQVWSMRPPRHNERRKTPAVLEIHGGPHAQYGVGFFHEFQVLAAAGYIVFYSNPRGSKGYGREHCHAIRGDWGNKDWIDIQAVTKFMESQRDVDTSRMGVMGGSYGGYMTNWVIGNTNKFAGAITDRCVSNLISMAGNSDFIDEPERYWPGNAWDKPEKRWAMSPIRFFGKVKTPTLIIHSEGDLRCNVEQAEQVFAALQLRRIPTRFVRYPRSTSHGMSRNGPPDMREHRLAEILDWWAKYLK